ncbi:hypothetical protein HanIR_Chr16g0794951 [Helianthus annuus]|nr:hypothetical protein HanIR_Chr16g0794951 [Helianthus annuus]
MIMAHHFELTSNPPHHSPPHPLPSQSSSSSSTTISVSPQISSTATNPPPLN